MDGGNPRRQSGGNRGRLRIEVHAALVVFRRGRSAKIHGPTAAQYVGHEYQICGLVDHHGRWKMGRDNSPADILYQHFLVTSERRFWRCVLTGESPRPYGIEPPKPKVEAVRTVDMPTSIRGRNSRPSSARRGRRFSSTTGQGGAEGVDAGGREGGVGPRRPSKEIEIRSDQHRAVGAE